MFVSVFYRNIFFYGFFYFFGRPYKPLKADSGMNQVTYKTNNINTVEGVLW